jgi:hypothetical protein
MADHDGADWTEEFPGLAFSRRHCPLCGEDVGAPVFGRHVTGHSQEEQAAWPGGATAMVETLIASVATSIEEAEGYPDVVAHLEMSRRQLEQLLRQVHRSHN